MGLNWRLRRAGQSPEGFAALDLLWPDSVTIHPHYVKVGDRYLRTYAVVGFPREIEPGWLLPLMRFSRPHTAIFYTRPLATQDALAQMKRRLIVQRGSESADAERGRMADPLVSQALADTARLQRQLVRGDARMVETGLTFSVWADSLEALEDSSRLLISLTDSLLLVLRLLRFEQDAGLLWTLPGGLWPDNLREMDTAAWSCAFPFGGDEVTHLRGQIWGDHAANPSWVIIDRFQMPSPHSVILGWSGSGKSYFAKLEAIRSRYRNLAVAVVDPEGEYGVLSQAGATVIRLGTPEAGIGFEPFELDASDAGYDGQMEFLLRLLPRLVDGWQERHANRVAQSAYDQGRVENGDPSTSPLAWIARLEETDAETHHLVKTAQTRWRQLGGSPRRGVVLPEFVVYDLSQVSDRMKAAGYLVLAEMLARTTPGSARRLVIIDEAWYLVNDPDTAPYLESLFRRARKWGTALSLISQDFGDFTQNRAAEVCLRNAPLLLLLRQHRDSLHQLQSALRLTPSEIERVAVAGIGQGLLLAGEDHVPLNIWATPAESALLAGTAVTSGGAGYAR